MVLEDALAAITSPGERTARLEEQMTSLLESWPSTDLTGAFVVMFADGSDERDARTKSGAEGG